MDSSDIQQGQSYSSPKFPSRDSFHSEPERFTFGYVSTGRETEEESSSCFDYTSDQVREFSWLHAFLFCRVVRKKREYRKLCKWLTQTPESHWSFFSCGVSHGLFFSSDWLLRYFLPTLVFNLRMLNRKALELLVTEETVFLIFRARIVMVVKAANHFLQKWVAGEGSNPAKDAGNWGVVIARKVTSLIWTLSPRSRTKPIEKNPTKVQTVNREYFHV